MTRPLVLTLDETSTAMAHRLATKLGAELGAVTLRTFPDGETYLRVEADVRGRAIVVVSAMTNPDAQTLRLIFLTETLRELEAASIGWVTPYLPYMRQDSRFHPGEALTSKLFARLISDAFDWLVTVDPHLHRLDGLDEVYSIPCRVVHAAEDIATWLEAEVVDVFLVGPDAESEQWVSAVADRLEVPFVILEKVRNGDRDVTVSGAAELEGARGRQVVILDDIISTGRTMIETIDELAKVGVDNPICVGIHGLFVESALSDLRGAGAGAVVTTNTLEHPTNAIDVTDAIVGVIEEMLGPVVPFAITDGVA